ncbi:MAG: hypothetical protein EOR95_35045, partial [Mesorhizobium sp.]
QRSRLKNLIQSILHAHLIPPCPHGNLVGISGRKWLARQILPADERAAIERHLGLINQVNEALTVVEADTAVHALQDPTIRRLMTLPGLDVTVAASVAAAIGDIRRFSDPQKLVAYLGLHRGRRHRAQACNDHLAHAEQGYRLHLGPAGLACPQVQIGRAACRPSDQPRQTRHRLRLQHPGQAPKNDPASRRRKLPMQPRLPDGERGRKGRRLWKSRRMRRTGYSTTSVSIGLPGTM